MVLEVRSAQPSICPGQCLTCWGAQRARRHRPSVNMCCSGWTLQPACLPACLPAWGQLGSRALWSEAPLGSPDWLESHLPNRLASCHKPMEKQRGLRGVKRKKTMTERQGAQVFAAKKKSLCSCMSDDNDYTVVILDCSSSLREVKNPTVTVGMSA